MFLFGFLPPSNRNENDYDFLVAAKAPIIDIIQVATI
jgi:hypothetical protein